MNYESPIERGTDTFIKFFEKEREKMVEMAVKYNGRLCILDMTFNWKRDLNSITEELSQNYGEEIKTSLRYMQKYNPEKLSLKEYREAYLKKELPWQLK